MVIKAFSISGDDLGVFREEDGTFRWNGRFQGIKVVAAAQVDSARCLLLLDIAARKQEVFENLLFVDASGKVIWKAELFEQPDAFVKFEVTEGRLWAWTWSGWKVRVDLANGKIAERHFAK